jgi:putative salt-induced outer membrane protein YdiY
MNPSRRLALVVIAALVLPVGTMAAQDAVPAPPTWVGSFGAGLAITSGNTNTSNWNVSFKAKRERQTGLILNADGLVIRGERNGRPSLDNTVLNSRAELRFADKSYVFGQMAYLRDPFKSIDYFFAPTAGLSYRFYNTADGSFSVNASAGASWESNPDKPLKRRSALAFGQRFTRALSKTATLTQGFAGNVVANDVGDGLYSTSVGLAASVTNRTQMKVEVLNTYRTTPPVATIEKSDLSTLMSFVFKF